MNNYYSIIYILIFQFYYKLFKTKNDNNSMNNRITFDNLNILTNLLTIPSSTWPDEMKYDSDDIYCYPQTTEEIFGDLVEEIEDYDEKIYNKDSGLRCDIGENKLCTIFENIENPVLLYEEYNWWGDDKDNRTELCSFAFLWDFTPFLI